MSRAGPTDQEAKAAPSQGAPQNAAQQVPSIARQKSFITDNQAILTPNSQMAILQLVMMEIGSSVLSESPKKGVHIYLDEVANANPDVLLKIYNIVHARKELLNMPARGWGQ